MHDCVSACMQYLGRQSEIATIFPPSHVQVCYKIFCLAEEEYRPTPKAI